ncbi:ORF3 [Pitorquevirus ursid11]|uniref:ORF3 n=1 Tax=Giant panda anellovirus TaxID=2016460 RepID=A0A220IGK5_9VIRU|nr:ORF3 [Giant panda anellovirus]ASH99108.1 ORF3 [Giant panda anellovirus]
MDEICKTGQSKKQTTTPDPATRKTVRVQLASETVTSTPPDSSRKRHWQELLNEISVNNKNWWRSSPNLYSSEGSENESRGTIIPPTPTPKKKINISETWPLASNSDWSESEGPPPTHLRQRLVTPRGGGEFLLPPDPPHH